MKKDKVKYKAYLQSKKWQSIKEMMYDIYGRSCSLCGSSNRLNIHHKTYKNIFNEKIADLMILCSSCHARQHKHKFKKTSIDTSIYFPDHHKK